MVLLHIISNSQKQASEIADLLVRQSLVLNTITLQEVSFKQKKLDGEVITAQQVLIIARTRGTLFNTVEKLLIDTFSENEPVIYSLPIVNMNWQEADILMETEGAYAQ